MQVQKGILGTPEDLKWRVKKYGENRKPHMKTQSILSLVKKGFRDPMMKILMASSFLSLIVAQSDTGMRGNKWILGTTILATCILITTITSISSYNCQ